MSIKNYRSWTVTAKRRDRNEETTFNVEGPMPTAEAAAEHFLARNSKLYTVESVEPGDGLPAVWPITAEPVAVVEAIDEPEAPEEHDE
jgi:hypothetical protein